MHTFPHIKHSHPEIEVVPSVNIGLPFSHVGMWLMNVILERVPYRNSLAFVSLCLNLDGQLCRDLNPGARGVVAKHLPTRPRTLSTGYS